MNQKLRTHIFGLVLLFVVGCGETEDKALSKRPKTFPCSGVVKMNGQPVAGATVVFSPDPGGTPSSVAAVAMTDSGGGFSLQAYPPLKGAVPGKYKVVITKVQSAPPAASGPDAHEAPPSAPAKNLIPEKYGSPETTDLSAEIPDGGRSDLSFDLN